MIGEHSGTTLRRRVSQDYSHRKDRGGLGQRLQNLSHQGTVVLLWARNVEPLSSTAHRQEPKTIETIVPPLGSKAFPSRELDQEQAIRNRNVESKDGLAAR